MPQQRGLAEALIGQFDADRKQDRFREAERIVRDFRESVEAIDRDADLTPTGKQNARAAAGKRSIEALNKWRAPLREGLTKHREMVTKEIVEAVTPARPSDVGEVIENALLRQEVRRRAQAMSKLELELLYRSPQADATVREALAEIPSIKKGRDGGVVVEKFVSDELRHEVFMETGRHRAPNKAQLLDRIEENVAQNDQVFHAIENEIRKAAPSVVETEPQIVA